MEGNGTERGTHTGIGPSGTGTRENGAPAPGQGGAPESTPRPPGSTGTRPIWAWGHRDWPHVSQGPGTVSQGPEDPPGPTRASLPCPTHPPLHPPCSVVGLPSTPPAFGHGPARHWGTAPPRVQALPPLDNPQTLPGPGARSPGADLPSQGQGCGRQAPTPLPCAKSQWCNSLSQGENPSVFRADNTVKISICQTWELCSSVS